eukprot:TRINITY_DN730_c0_g2_i9.p1 TRINITY_DN730_c0_g2~~TRINITY_DN730_c0_g2_i9.p1  ORF type:complete len:321 (-),score=79.71 TRINITY_DN730_c0_g2_i9:225-1118(-)
MSALGAFFAGIADACAAQHCLRVLLRSATVRARTRDCILVNGVILLGSLVWFNSVVNPLVRSLASGVGLSEHFQTTLRSAAEVTPAALWTWTVAGGNSSSSSGGVPKGEPEPAEVVLVETALVFLQTMGWAVPAFVVSMFLNMQWYQDIAVHSHQHLLGRPPALPYRPLSAILSDELYRAGLVNVYYLQGLLVCLVRYGGAPVYFVMLAWVYSFCCFEYKWTLHGVTLRQRIEALETHWAYFAGFGELRAACRVLQRALQARPSQPQRSSCRRSRVWRCTRCCFPLSRVCCCSSTAE